MAATASDPPPNLQDLPLSFYGQRGKVLGQGAYGKVYITDKGYAIKIIKRSGRGVSSSTNDLNELVYPLCMSHPCIINYHNVYVGQKDIALVMDYFETDLDHLTSEPGIRFNLKVFRIVAYQLITAVAYLGSRGIVHGDIKPRNILVQKYDGDFYQVKLADFGLARDRRCQIKDQGFELYTLDYRPPEILLPGILGDHGIAADLWALGCSLYECYADRLLFRKNNQFAPVDVVANIGKVLPGLSAAGRAWLKDAGQETNKVFKVIDEPLVVKNPGVNDLLLQMIKIDPARRTSVFELQRHPLFVYMLRVGQVPNTDVVGASCPERIYHFDRQIDYAALINAVGDEIFGFEKDSEMVVKTIIEIQMDYGGQSMAAIMAIELICRYYLACFQARVELDPMNRLLVGGAALYICNVYAGDAFGIDEYVSTMNNDFSAIEFAQMYRSILERLSYDLMAKTPHDDIVRFRGVTDKSVIKLAENILLAVAPIRELYLKGYAGGMSLYLAAEELGVKLREFGIKYEPELVRWWKYVLFHFYSNEENLDWLDNNVKIRHVILSKGWREEALEYWKEQEIVKIVEKKVDDENKMEDN